MNNWFEQHSKVIAISLVIAILITAGLVLFMLLSPEKSTNQNTPNTDGYLSPHQFLRSEIPDEDKSIMLKGLLFAEAFSTYENADINPLLDIANQSTANFRPLVESRIDSRQSVQNFSSSYIVDDKSVELSRDGLTTSITMNGQYNDSTGKAFVAKTVVTLIQKDNFWLVDNITFNNN